MPRDRSGRLDGRVVLITGAARGIGAETARRLSARGARIAAVGLEPELLERVAAACPGSIACEADVTDRAALAAAVEQTVARLGGIDTVIANAGIGVGGMVRSIDEAAFERTLEVNLVGVWRTVRLCLPHVIERRGYVLCVASLAALAGIPGLAPYSAAKAGVDAFAGALRTELRHLGVDVGVAYLSWMDTDLVRAADASEVARIMRRSQRGPLGRNYPVGDAAEALVLGVAERSRNVWAPGWVRPLLALRGLVQPVVDIGARRDISEADAVFAAEAARVGAAEASAALGAGGAADRASAARQDGEPAADPAPAERRES